MATSTEKSVKHGTNGSRSSHNGFSGHHAATARAGSKRSHGGAASHVREARLDRLLSLGRDLPQRLQTQLKDNPMGVIASVGAGAFVVGALLGSRVGRLALAAAIPHVVERVFEGAIGDKIRSFAEEMAESVTIDADA